jgi:hypothetical protein
MPDRPVNQPSAAPAPNILKRLWYRIAALCISPIVLLWRWWRKRRLVADQLLLAVSAALCVALLIAWPNIPGRKNSESPADGREYSVNVAIGQTGGNTALVAQSRPVQPISGQRTEQTPPPVFADLLVFCQRYAYPLLDWGGAFLDWIAPIVGWTYACLDCTPLRISLAAVIAWFGLGWGARVVLWFNLIYLQDRRRPKSLQNAVIPSQKIAVDAIIDLLEKCRTDRPGPIIGLRGKWGSGKSYLIGVLHDRLASKPNPVALIHINVWREESQSDLHLEIVRQITAHPEVLCRCLDVLPPEFAAASWLGILRKMLPDGLHLKMDFKAATMDTNMTFPMLWQHVLKRIVDEFCLKNQRKIVVVLDEIDRADPAMSQATIMLARRALELPGVSVILPFVPEHLAYKVFNPLQCYSPDLAANMFAILAEHAPLSSADICMSRGTLDTALESTVRRATSVAGTASAKSQSNLDRGAPLPAHEAVPSSDKPFIERVRPEVESALAQRFLGEKEEASEARQLRQKRLQELFSEKYVATFIEIPTLEAADIAWLVVHSDAEIFAHIRARLMKWVQSSLETTENQTDWNTIETQVMNLIRKQEERFPKSRITIRQYQGALVHISSHVEMHLRRPERISGIKSIELWLSIIATAYLRAQTRGRKVAG